MNTEHASGSLAPAVLAALDLFRSPDRVALSRASPLPEGVVLLLRVAGGDQGLIDALASEHGLPPVQLVEASAFFVQSVLFHQDSDHFRVLGVSRDADETTLKLHYRWLQKWLHPDRDPDGWSSVYSHRVNMAWDVLKRAERRAEYLESLAPEHRLPTPGKAMAISPVIIPLERTPRIRWSAKWLRRLPTVVAALTVLLAIGLWSAHRAGQQMLAEEQRKPVPVLAASMSAGEMSSDVPAAADSAAGSPSASEPVSIPVETSGAQAASAQAPVVSASPPPPEMISPEPAATVAAMPAPSLPAVVPAIERSRPDASRADVASDRNVALASPAVPAPAIPRPLDAALASTGTTEEGRPVEVPETPSVVVSATTASDASALATSPTPVPMAAPIAAKPKMPVVSVETPPRSAPAAPAIEAPPISPAPVVAAAIETEASVAEVAPPAPPIPAGPSPAQVAQGVQLMRSFSRAYRNGALQELVILFRPNARTPAGNLLDLHGRYQSQFAQSTTRSLEFLNVDWRETERGLEGVGRYEWAMRPRGGGRVRSAGGEFRIVIEFENGRALIAHLEQEDVG